MASRSGKIITGIMTLAMAAAYTVAAPGSAHAQKQSCGSKNSRQLNASTNRQDCMKNKPAASMQMQILADQQAELRKDLLRKQRAAAKVLKFPQSNLRSQQRNRQRHLRQQTLQRSRNRR
jgi:hypothetical protein